jgi:hypothetical protein
MKNTKNPMKNKNVVPEFVVVYTVPVIWNMQTPPPAGTGDMTEECTMLITRKELDNQIADRGTAWIKKLYKLGNEVKFLAPEYVEA